MKKNIILKTAFIFYLLVYFFSSFSFASVNLKPKVNTPNAANLSSNLASLNKSAIDISTGSVLKASQNDNLKWILSYNNKSGSIASTTTISDTVDNTQSYNSGSLSTPPGWTSNDSGNPNLTMTGSYVPSPATGLSSQYKSGLSSSDLQATQGSGDGWLPFFYHSTDGTINRVYAVNHHWPQSEWGQTNWYHIKCVDLKSGQNCPNYPRYFDSHIDSVARTDSGTSSNSDIWTSSQSTPVVVGNQYFYPAQRLSDAGIGCFDLIQATNCGYHPFTNGTYQGANTWTHSTIEGLAYIQNNFYFVDSDYKVYCVTTSFVLCQNSPYDFGSNFGISIPNRGYMYENDLYVANNKLFFVANNGDPQGGSPTSYLVCFDPTLANSGKSCSNFNPQPLATDSNGNNYYYNTIFDYINPSGQTTGICTVSVAVLGQSPQCFDYNNQQPLVYNNFFAQPPSYAQNIYDYPLQYVWEVSRVGNKLYVPIYDWDAQGPSITECYDTSIQNYCSGFGTNGVADWSYTTSSQANYNYGSLRPYGQTYDNGCLYGLGDADVLWSFSPSTGATPCGNSQIMTFSIQPSTFYCDGSSGSQHNVTWNKITFAGGVASGGPASVSVQDTNNNVVASGNIDLSQPSPSLDISNIPYSDNGPTSALKVSITFNGTVPNSNFLATILFNGDDPQLCFNTTINNCSAGSIANTANSVTQISTGTIQNTANASIACGNSPWFTVNNGQAFSNSTFQNVIQPPQVSYSDQRPAGLSQTFSTSLVSTYSNSSSNFFSPSPSDISPWPVLTNYDDSNRSSSTLLSSSNISSVINPYKRYSPDVDLTGNSFPSGITVKANHKFTVSLKGLSDTIATNGKKGIVYFLTNGSNADIGIVDDLDSTNIKNGIILYIPIAKSITVYASNSASPSSSIVLISNSPITVENDYSGNTVDQLNMGIATSDAVNFTCPSYNNGNGNKSSGCKTNMQGYVFAQKGMTFNYINSDVSSNPTLAITYIPNYIFDFTSMFQYKGYLSSFVGFDY